MTMLRMIVLGGSSTDILDHHELNAVNAAVLPEISHGTKGDAHSFSGTMSAMMQESQHQVTLIIETLRSEPRAET